MPESGDVIITRVKFTEGEGSKIRPALILFEEMGNLVIAGITTNTRMKIKNSIENILNPDSFRVIMINFSRMNLAVFD